MIGLRDILNSDLGERIVGGVSNASNQDEAKTKNFLELAMPVLTKAMQNNVSEESGAISLLSALKDDHDGSMLNNLDSLFQDGVDESVKTDGKKILGHILGNRESNVVNSLSRRADVDESTSSNLLQVAAPLLMGMLGRETHQRKINEPNQISDLLSGFLGNSSNDSSSGFLQMILDGDDDGSVIDDVAGMIFGR